MNSQPSLLPRNLDELRGLLGAVAACEILGLAGGAATALSTRRWLPTLDLPPYQPPGWVFGPVWTVLHVVMGAAFDGVRRSRPAGDARRRRALRLFFCSWPATDYGPTYSSVAAHPGRG